MEKELLRERAIYLSIDIQKNGNSHLNGNIFEQAECIYQWLTKDNDDFNIKEKKKTNIDTFSDLFTFLLGDDSKIHLLESNFDLNTIYFTKDEIDYISECILDRTAILNTKKNIFKINDIAIESKINFGNSILSKIKKYANP